MFKRIRNTPQIRFLLILPLVAIAWGILKTRKQISFHAKIDDGIKIAMSLICPNLQSCKVNPK
jgi:hypothetical protein